MGHIFAFITCTRVKWEATATELAAMEGDDVTADDIRQRYADGWHVDRRTGKIEYDGDGSGDYSPLSDTVRLEGPIEEHGWVDRSWSPTVLHDSRNDVNPAINLDENDEDLGDEVRELLEWLEGGYENNGDGTFYARDSYKPHEDAWSYEYAVHFTRKDNPSGTYNELPWHPVRDGKIQL